MYSRITNIEPKGLANEESVLDMLRDVGAAIGRHQYRTSSAGKRSSSPVSKRSVEIGTHLSAERSVMGLFDGFRFEKDNYRLYYMFICAHFFSYLTECVSQLF